jgi:hypothetical protein
MQIAASSAAPANIGDGRKSAVPARGGASESRSGMSRAKRPLKPATKPIGHAV